MKLVNLTPHAIAIQRTPTSDVLVVPISGTVARVSSEPGEALPHACVGGHTSIRLQRAPTWGETEGLPASQPDTIFIVSSLVAARCGGRADVFSPATGPNDGCIRDDKGRVKAVSRLIQAPGATGDWWETSLYCDLPPEDIIEDNPFGSQVAEQLQAEERAAARNCVICAKCSSGIDKDEVSCPYCGATIPAEEAEIETIQADGLYGDTKCACGSGCPSAQCPAGTLYCQPGPEITTWDERQKALYGSVLCRCGSGRSPEECCG